MNVTMNILNIHTIALSKALVAVFVLLLAIVPARAQSRNLLLPEGGFVYDFQVFFPVSENILDKSYMENEKTLALLDSVLLSHGTTAVDSILVVAQSSPEGSYSSNLELAFARASAMCTYLEENYPSLTGKIAAQASVAAWPRDNKLARLRYAAFRLAYSYDITLPLLSTNIEIDESCYLPIVIEDEPFTFDETPLRAVIPALKAAPAAKVPVTVAAVKTNLLYDALNVYNVELEFPIADRWSIAVEDVFPWWEYSYLWCLQMWELGVEARYWFKSWDPQGADKFRGWFAGAYGMSSKYDFQWLSSVDYQGEYWSAGITGGYSIPVGPSRHCRLEFSLSAGYLHSDWRHYFPTDTHDKLIRDKANTGTFSYWGPTKAKVSLVIPINIKVAKKEVSHD